MWAKSWENLSFEKIKASKKWLQAARAAPSDASHGADRPPAVTTMTRGDGRGARGAEGPNVAGDSTSGAISRYRKIGVRGKNAPNTPFRGARASQIACAGVPEGCPAALMGRRRGGGGYRS